MAITQEQVKAIRQELNSMKPDAATMGNQELTVKQTIIALAPTLERMKKRGFELAEIVSRLHDKGIDVKPQTLAKYLAEARREKDARKNKRQAAHPHCSAPGTACRNAGPQAADTAPKKADNNTLAHEPDAPRKSAKWDEDEDWIRKIDYSHRGKFEIRPDTPIGEL